MIAPKALFHEASRPTQVGVLYAVHEQIRHGAQTVHFGFLTPIPIKKL